MVRRIGQMAVVMVFSLLIGGCASVDTSQRIGQVKDSLKLPPGVDLIWQKSEKDAALVKEKVDGALNGGLTQDEAVAIALINNQALQANLEELGVSQAELVGAGLFTNPTLGALVRFPVKGEESGTNVELSLGLNLADAWLVPLKKDVAKAALHRATLEVAQMVLETRRDAKAAYSRVYYLAESLQLKQQTVETVSKTYETGKRRQDFGYMTEMEVQHLAADLAMAELELARMRMDYQMARNALKRVMGISGHGQPLQLAGRTAAGKSSVPNLQDALDSAQKNRVDLRLAHARAAMARHKLRLEKAKIIKEIHIGANWERETGGDEVLGPELDIELPLFDQNQAGIAKTEYMIRMAEKKALAIKSMIEEQVSNSLAKLDFLGDKLRITQQRIIPAMEKASQFAAKWASLMQLSQVERLEAELDLLRSKLEVLDTRLEYALALADLELELGGKLPE